MARVLLRTASPLVRSTIEIMLGGRHKLLTAGGRDAELAIVDIEAEDPPAPPDADDVARTISECAAPRVLVLLDRSLPIPAGLREGSGLAVLRKPFERFELSLQIDRLLAEPVVELQGEGGVAEEEAAAEEPDIDWLEFPCVAAPAGAVLRRAASLDAPLWLLGEPGSGRRRIAEALCRTGRPARHMATWFVDQDLETALAEARTAAGGAPLALYVPSIDERSRTDQERLCAAMAAGARFRLIATSVEDPTAKAAAGAFDRQLYHMLSGAAVQISPLRERPIAIAPLVELLTGRAARRLGCKSVTYSADALARLQSYMWPGNLVELESVVTRTLLLAGRLGTDARVIGAGEIRFTPETLSSEPAPAKRPDSGGGRRLSAVATLTGAGGETRARTAAASSREARPTSARAPEPVTTLPAAGQPAMKAAASPAEVREALQAASASGEGIESVLSALAHDLRNPMVSIKTFAGVISSGKADSDSTRELGQLASSACDRIDGYIDTLLRYGAFGAPKPEKLDLTEMLWRTLSARHDDLAEHVQVDAELPSNVLADRDQVEFLLNLLLDTALVEAGVKGTVRIKRTAPGSLEWVVDAPQGAVTQLRRISGDTDDVASWRVALARALTERNGGSLQTDAEGGAVTLHWSLPLAE